MSELGITAWEAWIVVIPLAGASLAYLLAGRAATLLAMLTAGGTLVSVANLVWRVLREGAVRHEIGGWLTPLGIHLYADGLSVFMLLLTAVVGVAISLYALGYYARDHEVGHRHFWPPWFFLWAALNALFLSADIFNLYVTLELLTLAAVSLVALAGGRDALTAGMRYLIAAVLGSLAYLSGVILLYGKYATLDLALLGGAFEMGPLEATAITLMVLGLLIKTALFPMHFWLPPAHSHAPAPVSAALSGLVVKGSLYILLRLALDMLPRDSLAGMASWFGTLGAAAVIWGSLQALVQVRLKMLIAYSTVAQVGYVFLLFPLFDASQAAATDRAWQGGLLLILAHALAKSSLFLSAGVVLRSAGDDRLASLRGLGEHLPVTATALALASISIMGLPPSGGFSGKWLLLGPALQSGQWWWALVMVVGSLLAAAYMFRALKLLFMPVPQGAVVRSVPRVMEWTALTLSVLSAFTAFGATWLLALLAGGAP